LPFLPMGAKRPKPVYFYALIRADCLP